MNETTRHDTTKACAICGETIYLTGNIWPHANGLLFCGGRQ